MDGLWIALGVAILVITFADIFLAVLNYNEPGIVVNRLVRLQWIGLRSITRRVSRRWRPLLLRQVTGILLLSTILWWIAGVVLGFTFIYLGLIGLGAFQLSPGVVPDFVGALYLSVGQFATVGADNISPAGGWVNLIPVAEALMSVVLLSFIITFLGNIYGVIQFLRSLCADFFSTGPGVGDPVDALRPYFPNGSPRDLDRHLNELVDDFNLYCDSLRQDHAAYHFQSGEDQFSLPFALYMTSGVVGALRWGLPTGHEATLSPSLVRLTEVFDDFRGLRYRTMRWRSPEVPDAVSPARFREFFERFRSQASRTGIDPWVLRFLTLDSDMSDVIGAEGDPDVGDAYRRYTGWLAFAYPAQHFVSRVSQDLDYQPIYRGVASGPDDLATPSPTPDGAGGSAARGLHKPIRPNRRAGGVMAWARRRLFLDPGYARLSSALRTLGAVVVAVGASTAASLLLGVDPTPAGVFATVIAVFSVPMTSGWGPGLLRGTGLLTLIPVGLGITAGAFLPRDTVSTTVALALVAAVTVWLGRFGPRWAMWGQVAFIAYYFSLLLAVTQAELLIALLAAAIGVVSSWLANLLPAPRPGRQIRSGIVAVAERARALVDAGIDALSGGTDPRASRVLRAENAALRNSVTSLIGLLDPETSESATGDRALERTLQAFDVQLAAENLLRALPDGSDYAVTVADRARLAGELVAVQQRLDELRRSEATATSPRQSASASHSVTESPDPPPDGVQRAHAAIRELSDAIVALLSSLDARTDASASTAADALAVPASREARDRVARGGMRAAGRPDRTAVRSIDRRAVQVGVATGVALLLARLVSTTHQYWAAMPAYQALTGSDGERLSQTVQRLIGTVIGAAGAFGLALWTGHDSTVAFVVVVVSVFFMSFLRPIASSWTAFWQTVLLATMYDLLVQLDAEAIHVRVAETLIGAVVAAIVAAVILPTRTRTRILDGMSTFVTTTAGVVHAGMQRLADPGAVADAAQSRALAEAQATMQRQLDDVLAHSQSLRRDPGSLQRTGIETQVATLTALAFYARRLVADPPEWPSQTTTRQAAAWHRLDGATRDNFQSTLAVIDDRLPPRVHDPREFTTPGLPCDDGAVATVARINETLLACMAAIRPGSADTTSNSAQQ